MTDLSITASEVQPGTDGATFDQGTAGATITAGQTLYIDTADSNKLKLGDCDSATLAVRTCAGIALHAALAGQPIRYQTGGPVTIGASAAMVVGTVFLLSDTPGGIMPAADLEIGDYTSVLGVATAAGVLALKINNSGALKVA